MIRIDKTLLDATTAEAKASPRRRKNYNFHKEYSDTLQRLLNAMEPLSYIQPHKHEDPDKREVFFALRGRILVVEFDNEGNIMEHIVLDPAMGSFGVEIPEKTFHTIVSLETGTVAYEFKDGPYSPVDDKNFASWAPAEGSPEAMAYLENLIRKLNIGNR
ncbi:MAG: WbuC family cupin fold metalloprotein [Bacteroidetes bacterium]|nr:WbuC family cupin fold metalloprotein [Bacteroidota bacterium]